MKRGVLCDSGEAAPAKFRYPGFVEFLIDISEATPVNKLSRLEANASRCLSRHGSCFPSHDFVDADKLKPMGLFEDLGASGCMSARQNAIENYESGGSSRSATMTLNCGDLSHPQREGLDGKPMHHSSDSGAFRNHENTT